MSAIWKGIISLITIKTFNRSNIPILDKNCSGLKLLTGLNIYFVNVGPNIDNNISISKNNYFDKLKNIRVNNSCEIIQSLDVNKSPGCNSLPVQILNLSFLQTYPFQPESFLIFVK